MSNFTWSGDLKSRIEYAVDSLRTASKLVGADMSALDLQVVRDDLYRIERRIKSIYEEIDRKDYESRNFE